MLDLNSPEGKLLRQLKMDAESESEQRVRLGRGYKGTGAAEAYSALIGELTGGTRQGQTEQMKDGTARYGIDRREDGATLREGMSQDGANARAALTAGVQVGELGLKREAQGFQTRAAAQLEQAQQGYLNAKTPEEKQSALEKLQVLQGKFGNGSLKDSIAVVGGGQAWDDKAGAVINLPQRLVDLRTGNEVGAAPQTAVASAPDAAVKMLQQNPALAAQFDQKYGPGASARYLNSK